MEWLNYWSGLLQVGKNCRCLMALSLVFLSGMAWSQRASEFRVRDPFVVRVDDVYYLYNSTTLGEGAPGVSVRTSRDLVEWSQPQRVMDAPSWVKWVWAPEVHKYNGAYYMLVTLKAPPDPANPVKLLGPEGWKPDLNDPSWHWTYSFRADRPEGPFKMVSKGPLTPKEWVGLDGTLAIQDGKPYLVFTHDWAQIADGTIELAPLKDDLSALAGPPKTLFRASCVAPGTVRGVTDGPFVYRSRTGKLFITWSTHNPEKLRKGERGYCVVASESASGRLEGPWGNHRIIFDENGGHGMVFETVSGERKFTIHHPEIGGQERTTFLDFIDDGDSISIRRPKAKSPDSSL